MWFHGETPFRSLLLKTPEGVRPGVPEMPRRSSGVTLLPGFVAEEYELAKHELPPQSSLLAHTLVAVADTEFGNVVRYSNEGCEHYRHIHPHDVSVRSFEQLDKFGWTRSLRVHIVSIFPDKLAELGMELTTGPASEFKSIVAQPDAFIASLIHRLSSELFQGAPHGVAYAESLAMALAFRALAVYGVTTTRRRSYNYGFPAATVASLIDYIHDHLDESISISDLAARTGYPPFVFQRLFKRSFGCPVHHFLTRTRVREARRLMSSTVCHNMSAIAAATGFSHQSHLLSTLRRYS